MAWQSTLIRIVRAIINDLTEPYTYCEERLEELIVIAAQLTKNEVDFSTTYTISVGELSISPDPVDNQDDAFINLVALKTSCLILNGEAKLAASQNIRVTDAGASVDFAGQFDGLRKTAESICQSYKEARAQYVLGNVNTVKAILTPYTSPNVTGGIYFE